MKKALLTLMCMAAIMAAGTSLKAQEVTIVLNPGWTWISCPTTEAMDFATALGDFTPMQGDLIKSQWGQATYINGQWRGGISQFVPGYGYHYKSNRTVPVMVTFNVQQPTPQGNDHEYVDLGLPSGLLWATCNIGANSPEDYGDYFAWGETQPKDDYSWSTYQYSNGSFGNTLTKYCSNSSYGYNGFTDNLTTLLPEDDAAMANWGTDWRMPTKEEWQELRNNTTVIWTAQNGVYGRLFTAANGNSIFLPAAGFRTDDLHYYAGSFGDYWSSSLNTIVPDGAWGLDFGSGNEYNLSGYSRASGFTVRPVRSSGQSYTITVSSNPTEGGTTTGGGTYEQSQSCEVTATANTGYTFTNWTENDSVVSTDSTYTFIVTESRNLVANFEPIPTVNVYAWVSTKKIIADDITPELVSGKQYVSVPATSTGLTYGMEIPENAVSGNGRILAAIPKSFRKGTTTSDGTFFTVPTNIGDGVNNIGIFTSKEIELNGTQYVVVESTAQSIFGLSFAVVFGYVQSNSWNEVWSSTSSRRIPCEVYTNGNLVYP